MVSASVLAIVGFGLAYSTRRGDSDRDPDSHEAGDARPATASSISLAVRCNPSHWRSTGVVVAFDPHIEVVVLAVPVLLAGISPAEPDRAAHGGRRRHGRVAGPDRAAYESNNNGAAEGRLSADQIAVELDDLGDLGLEGIAITLLGDGATKRSHIQTS